ncbi:hypothetical protein TRFO_14388 [Tritrichomonas foetus]|uniref:RING-type domain-containing protein n=1 Tax=Tritrichomonas foetus TaxID=1144522 RepID=A0A1J4KVD2_9EUKA|nr:hypothetical protein TRFO_14388 [Tritrichomonas foetus]|eukprot:OHT15195.1 hypothetical protein TRFO_14388 [Tritrichomonas foetus]
MDSYQLEQEEKQHKLYLEVFRRGELQTQTMKYVKDFCDNRCAACLQSMELAELNCGHLFCINCLTRFFESQFQHNCLVIRCPICTLPISEKDVAYVHPEYIPILDKRIAQSIAGDNAIISCPSCHESFIYEPGDVAMITIDQFGQKIRPDALECLRLNRATCLKCQKTFCVKCLTVPFHEGFTCDEQALIDKGIVCRFCQAPASGCEHKIASEMVCWKPECKNYLKDACMHVCECGHACSGICGEKNHFGCAECSYECCVICKGMCSESPSVRLECGHGVHQLCVQNLYKTVQLKGRIKVPRCGYNCREVPMHECVKDIAKVWKDIDTEIERQTLEIMEIEDTKNEEEHVKNPDDPDYFGKPLEFAHDFFDFYLCEQCKKPFYGGHKDCGREDDNNQDLHYKCDRCSRQILHGNCPKHGDNGMVIKCFYCCNPALYFCWGRTYFCVQCHRDPHGSKKGPHKQCDGKCAFAPHPPNGEEVVTCYCSTCEEEKIEERRKKH